MLKDSGFYDEMVRIHLHAFETPTPWCSLADSETCLAFLSEGECTEMEDIITRNGENKGPGFYPWHRQIIIVFENEMRRVLDDETWSCPYWNFVDDANPDVDPLANPMWSSAGVGSNGREGDHVVVDGPFAFWPIRHAAERPFEGGLSWDVLWTGEEPRPREVMLERTLGVIVDRPSNEGDMEAACAQTTQSSNTTFYETLNYGHNFNAPPLGH